MHFLNACRRRLETIGYRVQNATVVLIALLKTRVTHQKVYKPVGRVPRGA